MNDARFCMRLPQSKLDFAQGYAAQCQMTVTELFLRYLDRLQNAVSAEPAKRRRVRNISKYRGIIKCAKTMADEELDAERFKYLSEKYA